MDTDEAINILRGIEKELAEHMDLLADLSNPESEKGKVFRQFVLNDSEKYEAIFRSSVSTQSYISGLTTGTVMRIKPAGLPEITTIRPY